jgi:hypothetical protein
LRNNPDNIYRAVAELCYLMNVEMWKIFYLAII